jgi:hypothetical protein
VRGRFLAALIAGAITLSGGIIIYKSQPHEGGRTTKAESAKTATD